MRFRAIGSPMFPSPMNAICAMVCLPRSRFPQNPVSRRPVPARLPVRNDAPPSSSVTSSSRAGCQFGALSLSTRSARTPSGKSWPRAKCCDIRYSMVMVSPNVRALPPRRICSSVTLRLVGDLLSSVSSARCANGLPVALSRATISSIRSAPKQKSMSSARRDDRRITRRHRMESRMSPIVPAASSDRSAARNAASRSSSRSDATTWVAMPSSRQSPTVTGAPVSAR